MSELRSQQTRQRTRVPLSPHLISLITDCVSRYAGAYGDDEGEGGVVDPILHRSCVTSILPHVTYALRGVTPLGGARSRSQVYRENGGRHNLIVDLITAIAVLLDCLYAMSAQRSGNN